MALLRCAESLQVSANTSGAATLFAKLAAPGQPAHIRVAAFPSYIALLGEDSAGQVLAALTGEDKVLRSAALRALRASQQPALLRGAAEKLAQLPPALRESIIVLCGERGDAALAPAVLKAASGADPEVRRAAIHALGRIGDHSVVNALLQLAGSATDDERKAVTESLARLRGAEVDALLAAELPRSLPAAQRTILRALVARDVRSATPALLPMAKADDPAVRRDAIDALGKLAGADACVPILQLLDHAAGDDKVSLGGALVEICRRHAAAVSIIASALPKAAPPSQAILVGALGSAGGSAACAAVRHQLGSDNAEVRLAAVRVLAEWPDAEPLDDLAALVERTSDAKIRSLAANALNRMAPQAPARATRAAEALAHALAASTDAAGRKSYLAALTGIPCVSSLKAAQAQLNNPELSAEAAAGLVRIAEVIYPWHKLEVKAALAELKTASPPADLAGRAEALAGRLDQPANFAVGGFATSPDGLEKDGQAGGDQAAIDGDPKTYWDEADNAKLYVLRVQLRERSTVGCLRILGFQQHSYAPKDFEVLCDGREVRTLRGAAYENNQLAVEFPPIQCGTVELRITGYYGASPAIRELEISEKPLAK